MEIFYFQQGLCSYIVNSKLQINKIADGRITDIEGVALTGERKSDWDFSWNVDFGDWMGDNKENLYNFSGGINEPDFNDRFRQGNATVERNDLFEWLSSGYNRSRTPDASQFGSDLLGLGGLYSNGTLDAGTESHTKPENTTYTFRGEISTGIDTVRYGGKTTEYREKSRTIFKDNMSKQQLDSLMKKVNDSNTYWNNRINRQ